MIDTEAALDTPGGFLLPLVDYTVHVGKLKNYKNLKQKLSTLNKITVHTVNDRIRAAPFMRLI